MTDSRDWKEPFNELELIVRAAGGYVQSSSDLRPRVLESARAQRAERRLQRCFRKITVVVILLGVFSASRSQTWDATDLRGEAFLKGGRSSWSDNMLIWEQTNDTTCDIGWDTVDAFTEIRKHQAQLLRAAL